MNILAGSKQVNAVMAAQLYAVSLGLEMLCEITRRAAGRFVEPVNPVDEAEMQMEVWRAMASRATRSVDARHAIQSLHG